MLADPEATRFEADPEAAPGATGMLSDSPSCPDIVP